VQEEVLVQEVQVRVQEAEVVLKCLKFIEG
jgi:hypothetical protein